MAVTVVVGASAEAVSAQPAHATTGLSRSLLADAVPDNPNPRPIPPLVLSEWDGVTGVDNSIDPRFADLVADIAELDEDPEVRDAAAAALDEHTMDAVMEFLTSGEDTARTVANARKAKVAATDKAAVKKLVGTGGPVFKAEVTRVLAGTDYDRAAFLAYGADIARGRDAKTVTDAKERADQLRARVQMLAGLPDSAVSRAAQAAVAAGDQAISTFLSTGYPVAAQQDADAREKQLADQRARDDAAEQLSDLARKAARASEARKNILIANGDGIRALQRAANAMVSADNQARTAAQILAADTAGGGHSTNSYADAKAEATRQAGYAGQAAGQARQAAARATVEVGILAETGLTYGGEWSLLAQGMADAADAAVAATGTAQHTIDATIASGNATTANAKAQAHAAEALQWRQHAQQNATAAAQLAAAAKKQAQAAKTAADRTRAARDDAENARDRAKAAADRTHAARLTADSEAKKAAAARAVAQAEAAKAASARARAEQQAAIAANARGNAEHYRDVATTARQRADAEQGKATEAAGRATKAEGEATAARDRAVTAARQGQTDEAKAQTLEAWAAGKRGSDGYNDAKAAAEEARGQAGVSRGAANAADGQASVATGAAVNARAAATEATRAAARARAAAQRAEAAAVRADAAADKAEADAATTHVEATKSNAAAATATAEQIRAVTAARAAGDLARQAASEATQALRAAGYTQQEAASAANESISAAVQAGISVQASTAARASSNAIIAPANAAIAVTAPFAGGDIDADFVAQVANAAKTMGATQAAAAEAAATQAATQAQQAADAAARAAAEVKPAYDAAAAAARSAAEAARSAADALKSAIAASADGQAARDAATLANTYDAQAQADAIAARKSADSAASDATIADRSADAAEADASAARGAASRAESDAAAARIAAAAADKQATAAESAADEAERQAAIAKEAASNALEAAADAQIELDKAEKAAREAKAAEQTADAGQAATVEPGAPLNADEEQMLLEAGGQELLDQYRQGIADAGKSILQFIQDNGADILLELIGVKDAVRCFSEGNLSACLWTVVNVASIGLVALKLPAFGAAVTRITAGLIRFLEASSAGRKLLAAAKIMEICNCFSAGTPVSTERGMVPIEDLRVGDRVWARDFDTNRAELRDVKALFRKQAAKLLIIKTGQVTVESTPEHPFWVAGQGWTLAADLRVGDSLLSRDGVQPVIAAIKERLGPTTVYNFEVAGDHNYYITASQLLVHNCKIIWTAMKNLAEELYPGSAIPKFFTMTTEAGKDIFITPNAVDHLAEKLTKLRPDLVRLGSQVLLSEMRNVISQATANGIKYGEKMIIGKWEIVIEEGANGPLPALVHFQPVKK